MPAPLRSHAEDWLTLALGPEKAQEVMALPRDIREDLYFDILNIGPAGDLINEFCWRLHMMQEDTEEPIMVVNAHKALMNLELIGLQIQEIYNGHSPVYELDEWVSNSNYEGLEVSFHKITAYMKLSDASRFMEADQGYHVRHGLNFCLWLMNGQYLFPEYLVESSQRFLPHMNEILALLGLEPLSGKLATNETVTP